MRTSRSIALSAAVAVLVTLSGCDKTFDPDMGQRNSTAEKVIDAAKEGEYRFRVAAYAPRGVFELRFFKKLLPLYRPGVMSLARFASGDGTISLTRCQVTRDE